MTKEEFIALCLDEIKLPLADLLSRAYDQGYADASKENESQSENEIKWVDLKLPSGNLWVLAETQSPYVDENPYMPTQEDFEELLPGLCLDVYRSTTNNLWPSVEVVGLNGKQFRIAGFSWWRNSEHDRQAFSERNKEVYVWIKSDLSEEFTRQCIKIDLPAIPLEGSPTPKEKPTIEIISKYTGDKAILLLCKKS